VETGGQGVVVFLVDRGCDERDFRGVLDAGAERRSQRSGLQAVGAQDGELAEGNALDGELLLGVLGAVEGDRVCDEVLELVGVFESRSGEGLWCHFAFGFSTATGWTPKFKNGSC
jgi:hypothetical protein